MALLGMSLWWPGRTVRLLLPDVHAQTIVTDRHVHAHTIVTILLDCISCAAAFLLVLNYSRVVQLLVTMYAWQEDGQLGVHTHSSIE